MGLISNIDLLSIYQYYNSMKYYGNYNFNEIDNMLPIEREIFFNLLKKTIEEDNKNKLL